MPLIGQLLRIRLWGYKMIKTEPYFFNDKEFKRTFSDAGVMIRKVGTEEIYSEAVDLLTAPWQYEETDEKIEIQEVGI